MIEDWLLAIALLNEEPIQPGSIEKRKWKAGWLDHLLFWAGVDIDL